MFSFMPPPPQVIQWVKRNYPKPTIDPDWLNACYSWIEDELQLNPATDMDAIIYNIETQLLQSNLESSMLPGTGLPPNAADLNNVRLTGPPVLVEIVSMTEIGHSAFSLQNVRQARLERADLGGLAGGDDDAQDNEDAGPVPKYPRSMLSFELTDGSTILEAIEYRRIPEFELGVTPLGYKLMLKDVFIRRGIAWLEPKNIILKGYETQERQEAQDADFVRGLNKRLNKSEDAGLQPGAPRAAAPAPVNPPPAARPAPAPAPAPVRAPAPAPAPAAPAPANTSNTRAARPPPPKERTPLRQIDEKEPPAAGPSHARADDVDQPRRRKVPARPASPPAGASSPGVSRYFASGAGSTAKDRARDLPGALRLSPHRQTPLFLPESDDDGRPAAGPSRQASKAKAKAKESEDVGWQRTLAGGDGGSSDYDVDLDVDFDEMVKAVDMAEKEHGQRGSSITASSGAAVSSSSAPAAAPRPLVQERSIIEIEDDEEEKENVPAPTRHVRQRTATQRPVNVDDDVIELSD